MGPSLRCTLINHRTSAWRKPPPVEEAHTVEVCVVSNESTIALLRRIDIVRAWSDLPADAGSFILSSLKSDIILHRKARFHEYNNSSLRRRRLNQDQGKWEKKIHIGDVVRLGRAELPDATLEYGSTVLVIYAVRSTLL